jgi:hypothetical protein
LYEWRAHQVQTAFLRQRDKLLSLAAGSRRRLLDDDIFPILQCHSHQRRMAFRRSDDEHDIDIRRRTSAGSATS